MNTITKLDYQKITTKSTQIADEKYSRTRACRKWEKCRAAAGLDLELNKNFEGYNFLGGGGQIFRGEGV